MEVRLLGPVEVQVGPETVAVGPPQRRLLLAALATDVGRPVAVDNLLSRIWDQTPAGARSTLYTHITGLRRVLDRVGATGGMPAQIVRRAGGYVLTVDTCRVDVYRFRQLVDRSRNGQQGIEQRAGLLRAAVAMWRGEAMAGLPGEWATGQRTAWWQEYLAAVMAWARAEVDLGNADAVLGPLTSLALAHPFSEPLAAALLRALQAAGQSAEALAEYDRIRRRLADELGTDPADELQALHRAILRGERDHSGAASGRPGPPPGGRTGISAPAQLPADLSCFTGRNDALRRLDCLLTGGSAINTPITVVVSGTAGVGKTTLAVRWAYRVRDGFPDGQLYVDLRGFDPTGEPIRSADAVRGFLDALGVPPARIPADSNTQIAMYRSLLARRRVLVVVDNARDAEQVRPLLPTSGASFALVTSRDQLSGLAVTHAAHPLTLSLPEHDEALELLRRRVAAGWVETDRQAADKIVALCARLPIALAIVAAQAGQTGFTPATLAAGLAEAETRIDALDAGDPASRIRAVFSWSYNALPPDAARLFRLVSLHRGTAISTEAAASLAGHPLPRARRLLAELTRANLLNQPSVDRYTCHDLLRAYATDIGREHDRQRARKAATARLFDHYVRTACRADRVLHPLRERNPIAPPPTVTGVCVSPVEHHEQAMRWFTAEHQALRGMLEYSVSIGLDHHTWHLAWALDTFLDRQGHWRDEAEGWHAALGAAIHLGCPPARAVAHRRLATAYTWLDDFTAARRHLHDALDVFTRLDHVTGQAKTENHLAYLDWRQGQVEPALCHARRALELHTAAGDDVGRAQALNSVGWYQAMLGALDAALACCVEALPMHQRLGNQHGEAHTWDTLGYVRHQLGDYHVAVDCYRRAVELFHAVGDRYNEANVLSHLGDVQDADGQHATARSTWGQALDILNGLDHPDAANLQARLDGRPDAGILGRAR